MYYPVIISTLIAALLAVPPPPSSGYGDNKGLDVDALVKIDAKVGHLVDVHGKVIAKVDLLTGKAHYYRRGLVDAKVKANVNVGKHVDIDGKVLANIGLFNNKAHYYRRGLVDANVKAKALKLIDIKANLDANLNKGTDYAKSKGLKVDVDADVNIGGAHNGAYY